MSVYTPVSNTELEHFLLHYNLGKLVDFTGISAGMENTNYFLDTEKGRYVLTLYEAYSTEELPFFLGLMQHLSAHHVKTITPVFDKKGTLLNQLCGKPAAIIERLSGASLTHAEVSHEHCRLVGEALAHFHLAGESYQFSRKNERSNDLSPSLTASLLAAMSAQDQQLFQQELAFQQSINWDALPSGITHSDLFCDNCMFDQVDNTLVLSGIIDPYFACHDAYLYDVAVVANDWCFIDGTLDTSCWVALLSAYNKIRPLTILEKQSWVAMLRSSALRFWILRLNIKLNPREGEMVLHKDHNEFKHKLQACLQQQDTLTQTVMTL